MFDDPFFNNDPFNEPFEDVPFPQSPVRDESPLPDETNIYHPWINGAYRVLIPCAPMLMMRYARTTL